MPTATELSQVAITNFGPLTTVFTPPAACATASPRYNLAMEFGSGYPDRWAVFYTQSCKRADHGDCFPSGKALDEAYSSASSKGLRDASIRYFSPASVCPDSYTTVGVAAKNAEGSISSSGAFVPPVVTLDIQSQRLIGGNPAYNMFMEALNPNETAVVCCPSSYTIGQNGGCFSQVPETAYGEKTACARVYGDDNWTLVDATFSYNGSAISGSVYSFTKTSLVISTRTQTFSTFQNGLVPVASRADITLVYNAAATPTETGTSGSAAPSESAPSAAQGLRIARSGGGVGVMATAWAFAAIAGVALAMPW